MAGKTTCEGDIGYSWDKAVPEMGAFSNDRVIVVIKHDVSMEFYDYGPEDFPEIECKHVQNLTIQSGKRVLE